MYRFNPRLMAIPAAREEEAKWFAVVLAGDHIPQGFRNRDLRVALYAENPRDPNRHRQSAAIGRILKRMHVRGLVGKVPRTRRWRITDQGRRVLSDTLKTYRRYHAQAV